MLRVNVVKDMPQVDSTSYVDPDAIIIGRVSIGANCFIGAGVVIRADRFSTEAANCSTSSNKYLTVSLSKSNSIASFTGVD